MYACIQKVIDKKMLLPLPKQETRGVVYTCSTYCLFG